MSGNGDSLRILHLLGHASRSRIYGGPNTVAFTQASALQRRGHEIAVVTTSEDYAQGAADLDGIPGRVFRARALVRGSFGLRLAPGMRRWVARNQYEYDLAHVHLARDLVVLPTAATLKIPTVIQPHGMIELPHGAARRVLDALWTVPVMRSARTVVALTDAEASTLHSAFPVIGDCEILSNAVEQGSAPKDRFTRSDPQVLFLARLHPRKRAVLFAEAAMSLIESGVTYRFVIVGPDEGDGAAIRRFEEQTCGQIRWLGAIAGAEVLAQMGQADLYVLPAEREPFGVTLLEALSVGTPVIADRSSTLGLELEKLGLGRTFDGTAEGLARVIGTVMDDVGFRRSVEERAPLVVRNRWGVEEMVSKLETIYRRALE